MHNVPYPAIINLLTKTIVKNLSWPDWWDWEIEFTPHLLKRMEDRNFNEIDLREML